MILSSLAQDAKRYQKSSAGPTKPTNSCPGCGKIIPNSIAKRALIEQKNLRCRCGQLRMRTGLIESED